MLFLRYRLLSSWHLLLIDLGNEYDVIVWQRASARPNTVPPCLTHLPISGTLPMEALPISMVKEDGTQQLVGRINQKL
jgi:hypothetical protein